MGIFRCGGLYGTEDNIGPLVKSIGQSKSHFLCACEVSENSNAELDHSTSRSAVARAQLALTYMVAEIILGKTVPVGSQGNRGDFQEHAYTRTLTPAGSDRIRVCMFLLNSEVAAKKVGLAHEALATMVSDCLFYQVDLLTGDANMAFYSILKGHRQ